VFPLICILVLGNYPQSPIVISFCKNFQNSATKIQFLKYLKKLFEFKTVKIESHALLSKKDIWSTKNKFFFFFLRTKSQRSKPICSYSIPFNETIFVIVFVQIVFVIVLVVFDVFDILLLAYDFRI
jgi:hypothetical protein